MGVPGCTRDKMGMHQGYTLGFFSGLGVFRNVEGRGVGVLGCTGVSG